MFKESQSSAFWFQPVWGLLAGGQLAVTFSTWLGVLLSVEQLKNMAQDIIYSP